MQIYRIIRGSEPLVSFSLKQGRKLLMWSTRDMAREHAKEGDRVVECDPVRMTDIYSAVSLDGNDIHK